MSTINVLNMAGETVGTVELCDGIFGIEPNQAVVHEVVKNHLANCRQGTQSALTRAEVSGGGKKPWRQKGTGHARQGSTRAPQWTHGGIVFAPKPRDYSYVLNKKVKRLALKSVLSAKVAEGEMVVIEPDVDGLHIYRSTVGVMTNSPGYPWHRTNLLNYVGLRDLDYDEWELEDNRLSQCFSGSGMQGLPGDWSSPSRFVRLAMLKKFGVKGQDEAHGVANMMHLFQSAAFPNGMVRVSQEGHLTEYDVEVIPYDYTIYTSVMCAESKRFYWTSYENQRVQYVDLEQLKSRTQPMQFELGREPDFLCVTPQE